MADDAYLERRMKEESANIKAESYQKVASLGGWAGAGRTLWAISAIGVVLGAAIGLVAPFTPLLVGASSFATASGAIGASMLTYAATGLSMGFGAGLMLGRISGSMAGVAQEQEKRLKEWTARQILHENPEAHIVPDLPQEKPLQKSFWERVQDNYRTYINPRVGLFYTALGAVGGLIFAGAYFATGGTADVLLPMIKPLFGKLTGLAAEEVTKNVVIAYSAGLTGLFGASFFFNMPKITSEVTHLFGEILSGRYFGRTWGPKPEKVAQPQVTAKAVPENHIEPTIPSPVVKAPEKSFLTVRQFASYTEMVAQQGVENGLSKS